MQKALNQKEQFVSQPETVWMPPRVCSEYDNIMGYMNYFPNSKWDSPESYEDVTKAQGLDK